MHKNVSKEDHSWDTEDPNKNKRSCSIMYQIMIIYESQDVLTANVRPWTIMDQNKIRYETAIILRKVFKKNVCLWTVKCQNTIIYKTKKILRKMYIHVQ